MAKRTISFKQWYNELAQPVPLNLVPYLLNMSPVQVRQAVQSGTLRVFTFKADNGQVYRMVRRMDMQRYGKNPLINTQLAGALQHMIAA